MKGSIMSYQKPVKSIVADNLADLRKSAGLTQADIASHLHYSDKESLDHVIRGCRNHNLSVTSLQIVGKMEDDPPVYDAKISFRAYKTIDIEAIMDYIEALPGVISVVLRSVSQ